MYKSYDPRAKIIKQTADEVFEITGKNPLLDIALKLEEIALSDDYFISRKLYPNVDFYSGLIYQAMGFPLEMFPVLFAIPRTAGWLAHWQESLDQDSKIARPRQLYTGTDARDYVAMGTADLGPHRGPRSYRLRRERHGQLGQVAPGGRPPDPVAFRTARLSAAGAMSRTARRGRGVRRRSSCCRGRAGRGASDGIPAWRAANATART